MNGISLAFLCEYINMAQLKRDYAANLLMENNEYHDRYSLKCMVDGYLGFDQKHQALVIVT